MKPETIREIDNCLEISRTGKCDECPDAHPIDFHTQVMRLDIAKSMLERLGPAATKEQEREVDYCAIALLIRKIEEGNPQ